MATTSGLGTTGLESTSAGVGAGTYGEHQRRRAGRLQKLALEAGWLSPRVLRQRPDSFPAAGHRAARCRLGKVVAHTRLHAQKRPVTFAARRSILTHHPAPPALPAGRVILTVKSAHALRDKAFFGKSDPYW